MRARYYEPGTGRFISEDPAMDGSNWFVFCRNNSLAFVDRDGKLSSRPDQTALWSALEAFVSAVLYQFGINPDAKVKAALHASSEAAKALTLLESSLFVMSLASSLLPKAAAAYVIGSSLGVPWIGIGLFGSVAVLGIVGMALALAAAVTIRNSAISIAIMFLDD
jgi:hypothetical protein